MKQMFNRIGRDAKLIGFVLACCFVFFGACFALLFLKDHYAGTIGFSGYCFCLAMLWSIFASFGWVMEVVTRD